MKKMMFTLMAMLTIAATANAMSYEQARNEALFLTDKMAYELNLTDAQYEAAYEINLDYLMGVTSVDDVYGPYWERRNLDLSYVLFSWQWDLYRAASYFFRPLYWNAGYWHFGVYARYPHRDYFYFGRPHFYASYRGGHSWRMNGGRSYYEGRRDFYRPGHITRDHHFGMRNGWDRGDYRNHRGHSSSTHFTANRDHNSHGHGNNHNNGGHGNHNFNGGSNHHNNGGHGNHNFNGGSNNHNNGGHGNHNFNGGSNNHNNGGHGNHNFNGGSNNHNNGGSGNHNFNGGSNNHNNSGHGNHSFSGGNRNNSGSHMSSGSTRSSSHSSGSHMSSGSSRSSSHSSSSHSGGSHMNRSSSHGSTHSNSHGNFGGSRRR